MSPSPSTTSTSPSPSTSTTSTALNESLLDTIQTRIKIGQESKKAGYGFKQMMADVIAGDDYNENEISNTIEETISSAPCVMYTWESSPSCKKAIEAFEIINANVKIVRLDDPWTEGNPIRAVLGRSIGRSSVPFIFINGQYIGGYDGGIENDNNDASGMLNLAFQGKLRDMLNDAGAMN
ncbi:hypothetical protein FRACYDRAFT_178883 [Fragilariopsis cylindrus CCMP1102]|uniref:Glutaredoxin domain-containing protein n=1 Tax=Fragilariopsis cylindrus CCMP1102 TaxID=635003 RepID=A0A1E7FZA0_9STRA|nr:hypothetical protein FRACYDRAFT_178883 [Fragilariopsis cylindrus CCMP1102]|eukprot:OEU23133.1 hypothetical protein FRACYDRAFT_178883 [Fragilariopsis cylindrus CCMP1102]